jgi:hypothetical protein
MTLLSLDLRRLQVPSSDQEDDRNASVVGSDEDDGPVLEEPQRIGFAGKRYRIGKAPRR